jgi:hypothetical protein
MRKINGELNFQNKKTVWVQFNPYENIGLEPKPFTARNLFKREVLVDKTGLFVEIFDFGSAGYFGRDSYSWIWVKMRIARKQKNPNRFYISIHTHNPKEVHHKTPENPEGSIYGGVIFGSWVNSVKEAINSFPNEYINPRTSSLYWNKTLIISKIEKTDLETGEVEIIKPTNEDNEFLNSLSYSGT